jgi:DNA repair photolyase
VTSAPRGRGAGSNPANRFERLALEPDPADPGAPGPPTTFLRDHARSIIARNDSPDIAFDASVNPYRGCEHGCAYCYARPGHEYLGFSAGIDFESRILVKEDAPGLLEAELSRPAWRPQPIAFSGVTDPSQPIERRLGLTRQCLGVLERFRNPAIVITKSDLVIRDLDLLGEMARWRGAAVFVSVTTLDPAMARKLEPRAATPARRLRAIRELAGEGIPVGVLAAPMIAGLTDHELPGILGAAAAAGARYAGFVPLRLPLGVGGLFEAWLEEHFPNRRDKVLGRVREMRGGRLNDSAFGARMRGEGPYADGMRALFRTACRRAGLEASRPELSVREFSIPSAQISLFE